MNLCYLEFIDKRKVTTNEKKLEVYKLLLGISTGYIYETNQLSHEENVELVQLWNRYAYEY
jgi:hypothetical protein